MDRTLDLENNKSNENTEITDFINELDTFLKNENLELNKENFNTLYNELYNEIPLASTYRNELTNLIDECMDKLSYDRDFIYFNYDKQEKNYYLDYYSEGNITREKMSLEDIKGTNLKDGTFWEIYDEGHIVESEYIKDNIKTSVESELEMLELKKQ